MLDCLLNTSHIAIAVLQVKMQVQTRTISSNLNLFCMLVDYSWQGAQKWNEKQMSGILIPEIKAH